MRRLLLILMLLPACAWPNADSTEETENLQLLYIASLPAPLPTVDFVDPARYAGVWYEIASIPQFFSQNCTCTTATYGVLASDLISVYNTCRLGSASGTLNEIAGVAYVSPATGNSILNVQFVPAFRAPYWIIALADDYSYAMVGDPYRGSLCAPNCIS